tara:strand:+ start:6189 stop:7373 length:1185 start_codon:yes stop_codon:yes gene_type:complete
MSDERVSDSELEDWEIDARTYLHESDWWHINAGEDPGEDGGGEEDEEERNVAYNKRVRRRTKARMQQKKAPEAAWWEDVTDDESELEDDEDDDEAYSGGSASVADGAEPGSLQLAQGEDNDAEARSADDEEEGDKDEDEDEDESAVDAPESKKRNWRKAFSGMEARMKKLEAENTALKRENSRLTTAFTQACRRVAIAPSASLGSQHAHADVVMHQIFTTPQGMRMDDVPAPYRFTGMHAFPHAVDVCKKTKFKHYQVEMRRKVALRFALTKASDGSKATEYDLTPSGLVSYKMTVLYADGIAEQCPVSIGDFARANCDNIITPSTEMTSIRNVVNGELAFTFNFTVCSSDTHPRNRAFMVQVRPTNDEFRDNERLIVTTPAFIVRHKVSAARS